MKLTQKVTEATHRVCVFGPPKAGKTELVGKLAEHYNLIWFDLEHGYVTLTKLPPEWQEKVELISIPDSRVLPMAAETMPKVIKGTECIICEEHGKVACALCKKDNKPTVRVCLNECTSKDIVVVDSLTQLSSSWLSHITKAQPDEYKPTFDDWGALKFQVEKFLTQVQAAKYNIVCITHEEEVEMEDGRKKIVPVCGSSKSSRNTAKYFDHVLYCEVKNRKHVVGSSTFYNNNIITGSRTNVDLEKSAAPSLLDIFTSWKGFSNEAENEQSSVESSGISDSKPIISIPTQGTVNTKIGNTPGQNALENLRKMQAAKV